MNVAIIHPLLNEWKQVRLAKRKKKETGFSHVDLDWLLLRIYYRLVKVIMVLNFKSLLAKVMNYWSDRNTHKRHQHFFLHHLWNVFKSAYFKEIFDCSPCALPPNCWLFYGRCLIIFWFIFAKVNFHYWTSKSKTVITFLLLDSYCSVLGSGDRPNDGRSTETYRDGGAIVNTPPGF